MVYYFSQHYIVLLMKVDNLTAVYLEILKIISTKKRLWLKAVTEPNSARHTAIAEWIRPESTENDGSVRFSNTGI